MMKPEQVNMDKMEISSKFKNKEAKNVKLEKRMGVFNLDFDNLGLRKGLLIYKYIYIIIILHRYIYIYIYIYIYVKVYVKVY